MALYTHTHTHTSTFRKIKRVANEATLFGVKNRLCVVLYLGKNVVLEIACFLSSKKIIPVKLFFVEINYADYKEFLCNYLESIVMCFLRGLEMKPEVFLLQQDYPNYKEFFINIYTNLNLLNKLEKQGGVA